MHLVGHMRPTGRVFETPGLQVKIFKSKMTFGILYLDIGLMSEIKSNPISSLVFRKRSVGIRTPRPCQRGGTHRGRPLLHVLRPERLVRLVGELRLRLQRLAACTPHRQHPRQRNVRALQR